MKRFVLLGMCICLMLSVSCAATFSDLEGNWAKADIEKAVELGLVSGYPDGTFKPSNNITRIEFIVVMNKVLQKYTSTIGEDFSKVYIYPDIEDSSWAKNIYKQFMLRTNLYGEMADSDYGKKELTAIFGNELDPTKPITREEAVALIAMFIADEEKVDLPDNFSDIGSATFPQSIKLANKVRITSGYPDGTFKPFNKITRAEATKMLLTFNDISYYFKKVRISNSSDAYSTYLEPIDVMKKIIWHESVNEYYNSICFYNQEEIKDLKLTYKDFIQNPYIRAYKNKKVGINTFEYYENRISDNETIISYKSPISEYTYSKKFEKINGKWYASLETDISL